MHCAFEPGFALRCSVMTDYGWDQGFAPGLLEGHKASYFSHELITKVRARRHRPHALAGSGEAC